MNVMQCTAAVVLALNAWQVQAAGNKQTIQDLLMPSNTAAEQVWSVRGGALRVDLNPELLNDLRITLSADHSYRRAESVSFDLALVDTDNLRFNAPRGNFENFLGGTLRSAGRFELKFAGKTVSFADFTIRPRAGTPRDLEIVDRTGKVWFYNDHVHYQLLQDKTMLAMKNMDLRLAPAAAEWLGDASLVGLAIGSMELTSPVATSSPSAPLPESCASPNWPNKLIDPANPNGPRYQADVLLGALNSLDYKRCQGCDGPTGPLDGTVVYSPNAFLRNSDTDTTADVTWHSKFSGNFPPYNVDQHPYLIWNVYRMSNEGQIEQIGRSGVKHAFLTLNNDCSAYNCGNNQILWRRCTDIYSSGNNDSNGSLGPRSEIIAGTAVWGRCGSVYDVNCDGSNDNPGFTNYDHRLTVKETQISDTTNYTYYYEGWYVVRDDVNIYNTMGNRRFTPAYSNNLWRSNNEQPFVNGGVIDQWVSPTTPAAGAKNSEAVLPEGRIKVAVRTKQLPSGMYRYDYAVMNFDYVNATTEVSGGNPANVRILTNHGINRFSVPALVATGNKQFGDGNLTAVDDWSNSTEAGAVQFSAPNVASELKWGTLYTYSFESTAAPVSGNVSISGINMPRGSTQVASLVPGGNPDLVFADSFE